MTKANYSAPYIEVTFTSVKGDKFSVNSGEFGGDIISLRTQKNLGVSAGGFSIQLVGRQRYKDFFKLNVKEDVHAFDIFRPMGLVDIYINGKEQMLGIIDSVSKSESFRGDKPSRIVTIMGRDMTALLLEHKVWYDNKLSKGRLYNYAMMGGALAFGLIGGESPARLIMQIYNTWMVKVMNQIQPDVVNSKFGFVDGDEIQDKLIGITESDGFFNVLADSDVMYYNEKGKRQIVKKGDILSTVKGSGALSEITYGNYYPMQFSVWNYQGDLMNFIKQFASYPFNELYVETGDTEVVIGNLREFSGTIWTEANSFYDANANDGKGENIQLSSTSTLKKGKRTKKLLKGKAYIVLRPTPYDDDSVESNIFTGMESLLMMKDLNKYVVYDSLIVEKNLMIGRNNKPTFYSVTPSNGLITGDCAKIVANAEYDENALRRYGYNSLEAKLDAMDIGSKSYKHGGIISTCNVFQKKLRSWYQNSDRYLSGTMTIQGNEKIRVGNVLSYERESGQIDDDYEEGKYYITGIIQNYVYGGIFESTLTLERGVSSKILKKGEN